MHIGQTYKAQTQVNTQTSTSMEDVHTDTRDTSITRYASGRNPSKMDEELGKYTEMTWPRSLRDQHKHVENMQRAHKGEGRR